MKMKQTLYIYQLTSTKWHRSWLDKIKFTNSDVLPKRKIILKWVQNYTVIQRQLLQFFHTVNAM